MKQNKEIKILIVDDEPGNLGIITKYLKDAGYGCSIASNGKLALERAKRIKPGVILLDVKMPGMDGFEVCRKLKKIKDIQEIPVIFLTGLDDIESKSKGFSIGGVDYITKPVQKEELLARVCTHLENFLYKNKLKQEVKIRTMELQKDNKMLSEEIAKHKETGEQLLQSEKLQAIGQLAGGIAHDFNNQLAGIVGYADILREELSDNIKLASYTDNILLASKRASDLTTQLLAYARKGNFISVTINLHKIVKEIVDLLQHTIDKRIVIKQHLNAQKPFTYGDPSQIQNAIMNLILNARDAILDGGEIILSTEHVFLNEEFCRKTSYEIKAGKYILLSVSDNGSGMDMETQFRMFEPFFTTKIQGKGTGMGLAAVYGTIKTHDGAILVNSELARGTTIKIYLPYYIKEEEKIENNRINKKAIKGIARILIVDDEPLILEPCSSMLEKLGYTVTSSKNGKEAVEYYHNNWKNIDLVILDLMMPEMSGKTAYRKMKDINPNIIVLLSSGYSISGEAQFILDEGANGFIQKPFRKSELSNRIAQILERNSD